jgi:hypothetical protein
LIPFSQKAVDIDTLLSFVKGRSNGMICAMYYIIYKQIEAGQNIIKGGFKKNVTFYVFTYLRSEKRY